MHFNISCSKSISVYPTFCQLVQMKNQTPELVFYNTHYNSSHIPRTSSLLCVMYFLMKKKEVNIAVLLMKTRVWKQVFRVYSGFYGVW